MVGSLVYLSNTRPNILHTMSLVSRFINEPSKKHFEVAIRILRYIQGTRYGITYTSEEENKLVRCQWLSRISRWQKRHFLIYIVYQIKVISWSSTKQKRVALSSAKAKYISATSAACEAIRVRRTLNDLQCERGLPWIIFFDNMSIIVMTKNTIFHSWSKQN